LALLQDGIGHALAGLDTFLRAPHLAHDLAPSGRRGGSQRFDPSNPTSIARDDQGLALLELVQDQPRLLMELLRRDCTHAPKVTPWKCHRKSQSALEGEYAWQNFIESVSPSSYITAITKCGQLVLGPEWQKKLQAMAKPLNKDNKLPFNKLAQSQRNKRAR
jgi:hypothetical protein